MTKKLGFKALTLATGLGLSVVLVSGCNPEDREDHESSQCAAGGREASPIPTPRHPRGPAPKDEGKTK